MADETDDGRLDRAAREAINIGGRAQLRARMDQFESSWEATEAAQDALPFWRRPRYWAIAAAIIALIVAGQFFLPATSPQQLFAQHFEPYRPPTLTRGEADNNPAWQSAILAYSEADYARAATLFQAIEEQDPGQQLVRHFYQGISYLAMEPPQFTAAISQLEKVANSDSIYREQARWNIALAYLAAGEKERARQLLEEIIASQAYQQKAAQQILKKL